jgi:hypothetical protein
MKVTPLQGFLPVFANPHPRAAEACALGCRICPFQGREAGGLNGLPKVPTRVFTLA